MVLPGVGAFGRCAQALRTTGLDRAVDDGLARGVPFLGICVGFQLLYEDSEESPGVRGLGVLGGTVRSLSRSVKRPQMQWNQLLTRPGTDSGLSAGIASKPWVYFVHSYAPEVSADVVATCDYGGEVVAAAERGRCGARSSTPRNPVRWAWPFWGTSWPRAGTGRARRDVRHGAVPRHRPARRRRGAFGPR